MRGRPPRSSPRSSLGAAVLPPRRPAVISAESDPVVPEQVPAVVAPSNWMAWARWGTVALFVGGGLLYATSGVLPVLFASAVVAYLLDRPIRFLGARGLSRDGAFSVLVAVGTTLLVVLVTVVAPSIAHQIGELSVQLKPALLGLRTQVEPLVARIEAQTGQKIPLDVEGIMDVGPTYVRKLIDAPDARQAAQDWLTGFFGSGLAFAGSLLQLALLPVFTYYLASEWPRILDGVDSMVPPRHRPILHEIASEIHRRIGGFIEGQVTLCVILGVLYSIGLLLTGIDLAVTIGMLSGALFVVPYLGTVVGIVLSSLLAVLKFGVDWHVLGCLGTFAVVQGLEGSVLTPRIVGKRVGLHPLVVMVAVVSGGGLMGIWGVLLAVPATAALSVLAGALVRGYRQSRFFGG